MASNSLNLLGDSIRRERRWKGVTATELARSCEISLSYLSKIEHGLANPSIKVVNTIATVLNVSPESLLNSNSHNGSRPIEPRRSHMFPKVVRRNQRKTMRPANSSVDYELLTPDLQRNLQLIMVRHNPGETVQFYSHEGEESILCLEGQLDITVGAEEFTLEPGDCISFDSTIPHSATASDEGPAILISAQTPPSF
jgi:quercetin dioxygenase-like cupin family protein/DNA-binding XRE family transcriptional regulator